MTDEATERPVWLDVTRAAMFLGISSRAVHRLADEGAFPAYRAGRAVRFRKSDLETYLQRPPPELVEAQEKTRRVLELWVEPDPDRPGEQAITASAMRLYRFGEAWIDGVAEVPCVICGETFARADIAEHLLAHGS